MCSIPSIERFDVEFPADPVAAIAAYAQGGEVAWLDSAGPAGISWAARRYSAIAISPVARLIQPDLHLPAQFMSADGRLLEQDRSGWRLFGRTVAQLQPAGPPAAPLGPGFIGYVGFESGGLLERLPEQAPPDALMPDLLRLALFDRVIRLDHAIGRAELLVAPAISARVGGATPSAAESIERWNYALRLARSGVLGNAGGANCRWSLEGERADHERAVQAALEWISAGDIYQVNLSQRIRLTALPDPLTAYSALRSGNPAPFGAFLRWTERNGDNVPRAVLSVSPERFLTVVDGQMLTSPIKGTRARQRDPRADAAACAALELAEKDAAELAMIVDLHRNDLGRVAAPGSVHVLHPRRIEAHPGVWQAMADITGRLRADCSAVEALAACFPAGSISGAPKIRALELIRQLEPARRGVYTGAILHAAGVKDLTASVAIRTIQQYGDAGALHVGGGVVADSTPAGEYDETLVKAAGLLRALGASAATGQAGQAVLIAETHHGESRQ